MFENIFIYTDIHTKQDKKKRERKINLKKSNRFPHKTSQTIHTITQSSLKIIQMFNCKLTQYCSKHYKDNRKESETITFILNMTSKAIFKHMNRGYGANRGWKIVPVKRCLKFK